MAVIGRMLGLPPDDDDKFREFVHDAIEAVDVATEERGANFDRLDAYLDKQIAEHRANPRDDLISYLLDVELFGEPLSDSHVRGSIALLLIAGIDTTWSAIGSSIWHLATHPEDRERLVAEPELMPTAVEEFLRAYAPVTMARMVAKDVDFHGCPMKQDDWVLLPFPAANRDPEVFDERRRRASSTGSRTGTPRSASASTGASAPTSPGSSCEWRSRSSWPASPTSSSPTPAATASCGASVRSAARASCPSGC